MATRGQLIPRGEKKWLARVYLGRDQEGQRQYAANLAIQGRLDAVG